MLALAARGAVPLAALAFTGGNASTAVVAPTQPLLMLQHRVTARTAPSPEAPSAGTIAAFTRLTAAPTVVPVVEERAGPLGGRWLRVRFPTRPNGLTGWVPASVGDEHETSWQIVIHRGTRSSSVLHAGKVMKTFRVVVGKRSTPTPLGRFFIVEKLHLAPGVAEGPWALATSAYSNVLQEFAGGPGQIALHGTTGLSAPLGTFSSHGCVRFDPAAITWIATHVSAGTPISVVR